jgi:rod shape-determining protein MreD
MVTRSYMSRREVEQQSFSSRGRLRAVGAILLQVLLPRLLPALAILDLPLVVTLFFAISRRSPIAGTITGATIGLLQDVLTSQPIGVNGMAKSVIGYAAASLGSRIDVENTGTRALLTFGFSLLQSVLLYLIERRLLGIATSICFGCTTATKRSRPASCTPPSMSWCWCSPCWPRAVAAAGPRRRQLPRARRGQPHPQGPRARAARQDLRPRRPHPRRQLPLGLLLSAARPGQGPDADCPDRRGLIFPSSRSRPRCAATPPRPSTSPSR